MSNRNRKDQCSLFRGLCALAVSLLLLAHAPLAVASGFDADIVVRAGDQNGDGLTDLFLQEKPRILLIHGDIAIPITLPPAVKPILLLAAGDGSMQVVSGLSSSDVAQYRTWPVSSVEAIRVDANADAVTDILLRGVSALGGGQFDQIVFASSAVGSPPSVARAIDGELQNFIDQLAAVIYNSNYFEENAPLTTSTRTVSEFRYLAEYCATPAFVAQNGPLSLQPPIGPLYANSLDDLNQDNLDFIADCQRDGLSVIHFDLVWVIYEIAVGSRDYSVFNQDALEIAPHILEAILAGEIEVGQLEKSVIQIILESIFGVEVFGDDVDDDDALRIILEIIEFLKSLDPTGTCLQSPMDLAYQINRDSHLALFRGNIELSNKISVSSAPPSFYPWITIGTVVVDIPNDSLVDDVLAGITSWTQCRTDPQGIEFRTLVSARRATTADRLNGNVDISVNVSEDVFQADCRDRAEQGGSQMWVCALDLPQRIRRSVKHEFGHILGFADRYDTSINDRCVSVPGFSKEIMSCGTEIYAYHLQVLAFEY